MKRAIATLRSLTTGIAVICFGFMVVAVMVQVLGRYVLPIKVGNAVETAAFAQVWLACIGAGLALRHGAVFAVDALPARLSLRSARLVSVLIAAGSLLFLAVLIYGGVLLTRQGASQSSPTLLLPMWIVFSAVPVGMSFMALEVVLRVVENWAAPFSPVYEKEDVA
ncbi:TRAP transporter small permease [Hoeflea ulvae]|uniref:TRAP transporter small permease protein n=1 Tax=Hoeflea ulvae TaxID=2983764 RepID=A0ABT3YC31_9HYPH|nr:TRAP transporter small permease [Hoeflea ulvae]MCY0093440.1 TRAP transporter small permease [Hoeflea ulvae]